MANANNIDDEFIIKNYEDLKTQYGEAETSDEGSHTRTAGDLVTRILFRLNTRGPFNLRGSGKAYKVTKGDDRNIY